MSVKLPRLETIEMMRCDGCGGLHPVEDCGIVIVKFVTGKNCRVDIPGPKSKQNKKEIVDAETWTEEGDFPIKAVRAAERPDEGVPLYKPKQVDMTNAPKASLVPPAFAGAMIPPGHADFETKGAKEHRIV